jgi:hypothetical protein
VPIEGRPLFPASLRAHGNAVSMAMSVTVELKMQ